MANAHLPNCHPDVTPDWFQETFSRTTYLEAIQTSLVEGFDGGRYQGYVQPDWCSSGKSQILSNAVFDDYGLQYILFSWETACRARRVLCRCIDDDLSAVLCEATRGHEPTGLHWRACRVSSTSTTRELSCHCERRFIGRSTVSRRSVHGFIRY